MLLKILPVWRRGGTCTNAPPPLATPLNTEQVNQVDSHTYDILSYDNFTTGLKTILI